MNARSHGVARALAICATCVAVGFVVGFFIGPKLLERRWDHSLHAITAREEMLANRDDTDPTPTRGTLVLEEMPIGRARLALEEFTAKDTLVVDVAAFGASDESLELHVVVENRGACVVEHAWGVAYGFAPDGRATRTNLFGAHYLAFDGDVRVAPGKKAVLRQRVHHANAATLAVGHVDGFRCADGTVIRRLSRKE